MLLSITLPQLSVIIPRLRLLHQHQLFKLQYNNSADGGSKAFDLTQVDLLVTGVVAEVKGVVVVYNDLGPFNTVKGIKVHVRKATKEFCTDNLLWAPPMMTVLNMVSLSSYSENWLSKHFNKTALKDEATGFRDNYEQIKLSKGTTRYLFCSTWASFSNSCFNFSDDAERMQHRSD